MEEKIAKLSLSGQEHESSRPESRWPNDQEIFVDLFLKEVPEIKWGWHGAKFDQPEHGKHYFGLIFYDLGTFKWVYPLSRGLIFFHDKSEIEKNISKTNGLHYFD